MNRRGFLALIAGTAAAGALARIPESALPADIPTTSALALRRLDIASGDVWLLSALQAYGTAMTSSVAYLTVSRQNITLVLMQTALNVCGGCFPCHGLSP